jgi:predicted helicase
MLKMNTGYIYIRENEYWNLYDAYKLGKTSSILDREQTYITSEIKRGSFIMIIKLDLIILDNIEKQLQIYFNKLNLHVKFNAGVEFYKKEIIKYIIPYFNTNNIKHTILSKNEIECLTRKIRIHANNKKNENVNRNTFQPNNEIYNPRDYQTNIINKSNEYFHNNSKGLLIIPCGVGKTLISLWITQKLNLHTILIGVPNKLLLRQWKHITSIFFQNVPYLIVFGNIKIEQIIYFLQNNKNKCIVITTYASTYKIYNATQKIMFNFDMKINDECHHLTTSNIKLTHTTKKYIQMLNISSIKQLSLTATLKQLESMSNNDIVVSNDNVEYFGEIIDRKCLLWAINKNIVCDYVIQTIITNDEQQFSKFNIIDENDRKLFFSAFTSLKSIFDNHSHHILIYSNNKNNSSKIIKYIKILLNKKYFNIPNLYFSNYDSEMTIKEQKEIIKKYDEAKFGIITCVFCLSEGYDNHNIDAVVFAENMNSNIRIVQSALRASRKNKNQPNKITKIILPIFNKNDWLENNINSDYQKVREIIYQMGLEDETITQKIKAYKIKIEQQKPRTNEREQNNKFGEYDDELTQKIILKTIKRTELTKTFDEAKKIIANKNIKSKESYYELCEIDNRLSKEPEIVFTPLKI